MSFAAMFAYITGAPFYLMSVQHFSPTAFGLVFATNALGIFTANYLNSRLVRRHGPVYMAGMGCAVAFGGAVTLLVAVNATGTAALAGILLGLFLIVGMTGLLGANCVGMLMARYPRNAGAAAALFGAGQFGLGTLASAAVGYFHDGSGLPMACVIVATTLSAYLATLMFRDRE
jgi:DHA1 family bicyclomycin/chloramphenicol resistance-like MFS transporter